MEPRDIEKNKKKTREKKKKRKFFIRKNALFNIARERERKNVKSKKKK